MPRVTVQDVAKGVRDRWGAATALTALIPAGAVFVGRAEGKSPPYAELGVVAGTEERTTGAKYLQRFGVAVACYTATDPPNADAVLAALHAAFSGTTANPSAGLTVPNAVAVVHCRAAAGQDVRITGQKASGSVNVVRAVFPMELLLECNGG